MYLFHTPTYVAPIQVSADPDKENLSVSRTILRVKVQIRQDEFLTQKSKPCLHFEGNTKQPPDQAGRAGISHLKGFSGKRRDEYPADSA